MLIVHPHQDADGGIEVVSHGEKQVDVVEILLAAEAMGRLLRGLTVASISWQWG